MIIYFLDQQKPNIDLNLEFQPTIVRSCHEIPDTILMTYSNNNAQFIYIMLADGKINCEDPHNGEITDIITFMR